jgi:alkanesulfonate monooxygenase SsuD/methylene tetrahydromethanopterin reductase-like flavin-dependent oxidoreductase (luciferase family)
MEERLDQSSRAMLNHALSQAIVGSPATVRTKLADFIGRTGADEVMITSSIFDHGARLRSFEIVAQAGSESPLSRRDDARNGAIHSSVA